MQPKKLSKAFVFTLAFLIMISGLSRAAALEQKALTSGLDL